MNVADLPKPLPPPSGVNKKPLEPGIMARAMGALKVLTGKNVPVDPMDANAWFGPQNPIDPVVTGAQREGVVGRQFDYPVGYNLQTRPRSGEAVTFPQMRALADGCDILRLVIETRKDQLTKLKFSVKPKDEKKNPDKRCKDIETFFNCPDGENSWSDWIRQLVEEMLVTDAATIYPWLNNDGSVYRMDLMDGATIKRVIDARGHTPAAPYPAYQQVLKGLPAVDYTADELIYVPRNKRVHKIYGYSPVEQIIMTVNIAIRRSLHQLQFYTEGSTPDLIFQVPQDWNMTQIKEFNDWWQDCLSGNTAQRRRAQFVPHGVTPINTKEGILKDAMDEWLARIICYAFNVTAQPFIKEVNRSTSETAYQMALEEGLQPVMQWVKNICDMIIRKYFQAEDIEFFWDDQEATDPTEQAKMDDINLKNGSATLNQVRASRGDAPIDGGDVAMVLTATGYVPVVPAVVEEEPEMATTSNPEAQKDGKPSDKPEDGDKNAQEATGMTSDEPEAKANKLSKASKKKQVPAINRETPEHQKNEAKLASKLTKFLKQRGKDLAEQLINKMAKAGVDGDPTDDIEWLGWEELQDLFGKQLALSAKLGVKDAYAQLDLDDDSTLKQANKGAINYADKRAAELVGKRIDEDGNVFDNPNPEYSIEDATREMIRADVKLAMEEGLSNDELADLLQDNYAFSETRAETIARTETAKADVQGNMEIYRESGVVGGKQWITGADCCDDCQELNNEIVAMDDTFSDGSDGPPAHPNCRCDVLPIINDDQPEE